MSDPGLPMNIGDGGLSMPQKLMQLLQSASGGGAPGAAPATASAPAATPQQPSGPPANPRPGDIVNYHKFAGGNPADPKAWTPLQGPEFISALHAQEPVMASRVQAILDGREALPPQSRMNPTNKILLNAVAQADPDNYDAINKGARQKTRDDFVAGNSALNIRNLNQAIGHLSAMMVHMPEVAGHGGDGSYLGPLARPVNSLINGVENLSGQQGITNYETDQTALSSEMAALLKGKGTSNEQEVNKWLENLSPNRSDDQKMGGAREMMGLLKSRLDELNQQYQQGMGKTATPLQVLNPLAADAYHKLSVIGQKVTAPAVAPSATAAPSPQDIVDELKKRGVIK